MIRASTHAVTDVGRAFDAGPLLAMILLFAALLAMLLA
jgi:hypothetical protein